MNKVEEMEKKPKSGIKSIPGFKLKKQNKQSYHD